VWVQNSEQQRLQLNCCYISEPIDNFLVQLQNQVAGARADIQYIVNALKVPLSDDSRKTCLKKAERAVTRLSDASRTLAMNPASMLGSIGGRKTAERGPEYYRQIAAMRKTRSGGRPKKQGEEQA
jgi:hypothetical protein